MQLARYNKAPADRKRYVVDYDSWLDADETIDNVVVTTAINDDAFAVDGMLIGGDTSREVAFYVSGGVDDGEYDVFITIYTTNQQIKEDHVTFVVIFEGNS